MYIETTNSATRFHIVCVHGECNFSMSATYKRRGTGDQTGRWTVNDFEEHSCSVEDNAAHSGKRATMFHVNDLALVLVKAYNKSKDRLFVEDQSAARRELETVTTANILDSTVRCTVPHHIPYQYSSMTTPISLL